MWSGGRFMHFGEPLDDERFVAAIRLAFDRGIRTFVTADVYGAGQADSLLGRALSGVARARTTAWLAQWDTTNDCKIACNGER